jgi:hypothetical protein
VTLQDGTLMLNELPATATCGEGLAWVNRMRRILDRWDDLPDAAQRMMTPELKVQANAELDQVEETIRRTMAEAAAL